MAALSHSQVSKKAQMVHHPRVFWWLQASEQALAEDLVEGFKEFAWLGQPKRAVTVTTPAELVAELDSDVVGERRLVVFRGADAAFSQRWKDAVVLRLEQQMRLTGKLLVLMLSREEPPEVAEPLFSETWAKINPPTLQMLGAWVEARSAGRWDYRSKMEFDSPFDPRWGMKFMEHVGWDWASAVQGCRTLAAVGGSRLRWGQVSALVPRRIQHGYADALVGAGGRTEAMRLAQGVLPAEIRKVLGAMRWRLLMFGRMRAMQAEIFPDREVASRLGVDVWWYREKFKPFYAGFTEDRIRRRLEAVRRAGAWVDAGVTVGVLEVLALDW